MVAGSSLFRDALISGTAGSVACAAVLMLTGQRVNGDAVSPLNAISHWLWGDGALRRRSLSVHDTALGYVIHHAAAVFWAVAFEASCRVRPPRSRAGLWARAAQVAALAFVVDFELTPHRFTPGFQRHLSRRARYPAYAAFAAGLALGAAWRPPGEPGTARAARGGARPAGARDGSLAHGPGRDRNAGTQHPAAPVRRVGTQPVVPRP